MLMGAGWRLTQCFQDACGVGRHVVISNGHWIHKSLGGRGTKLTKVKSDDTPFSAQLSLEVLYHLLYSLPRGPSVRRRVISRAALRTSIQDHRT